MCNLYLRSGHTVMRWKLGEGGLEILDTISWNHGQFSGQPFAAWVNAHGLVGMFYKFGSSQAVWEVEIKNVPNCSESTFGWPQPGRSPVS